MKQSLSWAIVFLLLLGCSKKPTYQYDPNTYIRKTLISDKCANPCWLGIEPGATSNVEHIKEVLAQFYGNENVFIPPKASQTVDWSIKNTTFPQRGVIALNQDKRVVYTQVFFDENRITIDNLISAIGEPEYVLLIGYNSPQGFQCNAIWGVLYLQKGLEIMTDQTTKSAFKRSQIIDYIGIEVPSTLNDKHWWSDPTLAKTAKWKGYGDYCVNE